MSDRLVAEVEVLLAFLEKTPLTEAVRDLEHALAGSDARTATERVAAAGLTPELLTAAVVVRRRLGRLNDLIHAAAIGLTLRTMLDDDEVVEGRPSLAAGNDPTRPYDLQTNKRVAEFKLAQWAGADAMRKRGVFQDLVHLAADESGRRVQLFVVGQAPIRFLRGSKSTAKWGLDRAPSTRALFEQRFGSLAVPIYEFTAGPAARVELVDLTPQLPALD